MQPFVTLYFAMRPCKRVIQSILLLVLVVLLGGCSALDSQQKQQEVFGSLQEVDRQLSIGNTAQAMVWADRAIAIMPHSSLPFEGSEDGSGLIAILVARGQYPYVVTYAEKALAQPDLADDWDLYDPLGDAQSRLGQTADSQHTYAREATLLTRLLGNSGLDPSTKQNMVLAKADAEWNSGDHTEGAKEFETIISTSTDTNTKELAKNNYAYCLAVAKVNLPHALTYAIDAVNSARDSDDSEELGIYLDTLGWVQHQMGNDKEAELSLEEAVSLVPLESDVHYHMAEIYRSLGSDDIASIEYVHSLQLNNYNSEAKAALRTMKPTQG